MDILIWGGAAISVVGLLGLVYCIFRVAKAKRANLGDDALREAVKKVVPINLGALFLSVIGLMMVILGVFLG
ncbi:hypothetical protein E7681_03725 [Thalassobius vesicularis]|uniref:Uncharacterized protein n=1 Tax=Thalassobius vesicularis TaxID=1294297 RepID=A0A4S3MAH5_9RHOB|nr:hypothetical protein [Thalassobius vesicularis]THD75575.1 hypothetical protein E7681_03725 [Thalassobius vesicularis]